jgi:hypothetical protein
MEPGAWLAWSIAVCTGIGVAGLFYFKILRPALTDLAPYVADFFDDIMSRNEREVSTAESSFSPSERAEQAQVVRAEQAEQRSEHDIKRDIISALPVILPEHEYLDPLAQLRLDTLARLLARGAISSESAALEAAFPDMKRGGSKKYVLRRDALHILAERYGWQPAPPTPPPTPIAKRQVPAGVEFDDHIAERAAQISPEEVAALPRPEPVP